MSSEIHVGDQNTKFVITIKDGDDVVDISTASTIDITFRKPSGTSLTVEGLLETDGTDGIIYYNMVEGDLDESGIYKIQVYIVLGDSTFSTNIGSFKVYCNL